MNKKLTIYIMCFCGSVSASEVLDSEVTDYETEYENQSCAPLCVNIAEHKSSSYYIFNPTQLNGVFQFQPNWYVINNKIKFVPVSQ